MSREDFRALADEVGRVRGELVRLREELTLLRQALRSSAVLGPTQQAMFTLGPDQQLVTLDQVAGLARLSKETLRGYEGRPLPRRKGRRGQSALYSWAEMRPWIEALSGLTMPENFPGMGATGQG